MAYTKKQWEVVKAYFEQGESLTQITQHPQVDIKDRSTISKKAKDEGWDKGKFQHLREREVQAKQDLAQIATEKSTLNSTQLMVHESLVAEKIVLISRIKTLAMQNLEESMVEECLTQTDFRHRSHTAKNTLDIVDPPKSSRIEEVVPPQLNQVTMEEYLQARAVTLKDYIPDDA